MKKILIIGALALVILGCVLAAGCTSTNDDNVNQLSGSLRVDEQNPQDGAPGLIEAKIDKFLLGVDVQKPSPKQEEIMIV